MAGTGGFQTQAYNQPVMAVAGDFASQNPYFSYDAGPGGLLAGANGVTIGAFAWAAFPPDSDGTPALVSNTPAGVAKTTGSLFGPPAGFVHRAQQALITTFLADASMVIPQGFPVTLMTGGDFWVVNNGTTDAQMGQKVFASVTNGLASMAASGSYPANVAGTSATVGTTAVTVTASINGNILTVAAITAGAVYPGAVLASPGAGAVVQLLSGTPTGTATYLLSVGEQSVTATQIVGNMSILTIPGLSGTQTVPFSVGQVVFGGGLPAIPPVMIAYSISGSGAGVTQTMVLNNPSVTVTATTINGSNSVETKWWVQSTGLTGELVKITDHPPS